MVLLTGWMSGTDSTAIEHLQFKRKKIIQGRILNLDTGQR